MHTLCDPENPFSGETLAHLYHRIHLRMFKATVFVMAKYYKGGYVS